MLFLNMVFWRRSCVQIELVEKFKLFNSTYFVKGEPYTLTCTISITCKN